MTAEYEGAEYTPVDAASWTLRDEETRRFVSSATGRVSSLVRSTLGPNGLDAQIETLDNVDEPETIHTTDAAEILDAIERGGGFSHPVAALFVDSVDAMQRGLGDGSTTAIVLADALVREGIDLIESGVHPSTVVVGYSMAAARAGTVLDALASEVDPDNEELLRRVAATSMTADIADPTREAYATQVAEVVRDLSRVGDTDWIDTDDAKVLADRAATGDRYRGIVVRRYPGPLDESEEAKREFDWSTLDPMTDATVALCDREIDFERTALSFGEGQDSGVELATTEGVSAYTEGLDRRIAAAAERLVDLGVDVFVSQPEIDEGIERTFEARGIIVVDGVKYPRVDVYRLARATGGTVVDDLDDLTPDRLGTVGSLSERRVGDEKWTFFDDCDGGVFTLVVGTGTDTASAEHERLLEDALEVTATAVTDRQALPEAGAPAMAVASALRAYAPSVSDKEQLAIEAFADAMETIPRTLARNAGVDRLEGLVALRGAHARSDGEDPASIGLSADGEPIDAREARIVAPRRVFSQAIETARAIAEQLLTVDAVLHPGVDLGTFRPEPERD